MMPKKPTKAATPANVSSNEVTLTIRVSPEGFAEARKRLDELEAKAREQAGRELQELTADMRARTADLFAGMTEDEALADIQETVDEVRAETRQEREAQR